MFRHLVPLLVLALPGLAQTSSSFESDYPSLSPTSAPVASTIIANKDPSMECPVCGYGMTVGTSGGLVITSFGMYSCASLYQLGEEGKIAVGNDCWEAQALAEEKCQCKLLVDEAPTETPTHLTSEESALDRDPVEILENEVEGDAEPYFCSICDNGMVISNYDELVMIDGQPNRTCLEYQEIADNGALGDSSCRTLQESAQEPCGCTFIPDSLLNNETETGVGENLDNNSTETASETEPPTEVSETPPVEGEGTEPPPQQSNGNEHCFDNLSDIRSLERHVVDVSVQRKYILCPDTVFDLGHVDADGNIVDGQMPIQLRPNVIYQCGEDGLRSSNCILKGGDFGVMSFYGVYDGIYETVHGAELHGLTFESQERFTAVLKAAGEVSFVECAFVVGEMFMFVFSCIDTTVLSSVVFYSLICMLLLVEISQSQSNMVPILLQWEGQGPSEMMTIHASRNLRLGSATTTAQSMFQLYASGSASKLQEVGASPSSVGRRLDQNGFAHVVKFIRCVFKENRATSDLAFPGLIENSYGFSELFISETLFEDNQYGESNPAVGLYSC